MKSRASLFFLFLFLFTGAFAQRTELSATLNRNKILIGEPIELYLKALLPKSGGGWFTLDTLPHFEIMSRSKIDSQQTDRGLFLQQTLTLTSWDSGRWQLPSLVLLRGRTDPLVVEVGYTKMDPDQPYHDIRDILDVPKGEGSSWYWYLLGVAVLIALFLLFFPPSEKKEAKPVVQEDPYKVAMQRLETLKEDEEPKRFQTELVDVFRTYLFQRKGLQSHSKTTEDLVGQLRSLSLPGDLYHQVSGALQLSDLVKFARYQPQVQEQRNSRELIIQTIKTIEGNS